MTGLLKFSKPVLVYIPCYNCEQFVEGVIEGIPIDIHDSIECLVIDNQSDDSTSQIVKKIINEKKYSFKIHLIKPAENVGYAGSQKLAYFLAINSPAVKNVVMLHGDGQYLPFFISDLLKHRQYAVVNGYRCKKIFPDKEETPFHTYIIIKVLTAIENILTGMKEKEWHSGFAMFRTDYLRKLPLQLLTDSTHIDGDLLICANILKEKTFAVPIYKKYREMVILGVVGRFKHVYNVFKIIKKVREKYYHNLLAGNHPPQVATVFEILEN